MNVKLFNSGERWQILTPSQGALTQMRGRDARAGTHADTCMQTHQFPAHVPSHREQRRRFVDRSEAHELNHTHTHTRFCLRFHCVSVPLCSALRRWWQQLLSGFSAAIFNPSVWFFQFDSRSHSRRSLQTRPSTTNRRKKNKNKSMVCPCICQRALAALPSLGQQAARGQL